MEANEGWVRVGLGIVGTNIIGALWGLLGADWVCVGNSGANGCCEC